MFEDLKKFKKILVTGPHRSGTRITTRMIAHDTGHEYLQEDAIQMSNKYYMKDIVDKKTNFVLQCPAMANFISDFVDEDTLVVISKKPIEDILDSQKRFNLKHKDIDGKSACVAKYDKLIEQEKLIPHFVYTEFSSLKDHPLWVSKEKRKNFKIWQTYENQKGVTR